MAYLKKLEDLWYSIKYLKKCTYGVETFDSPGTLDNEIDEISENKNVKYYILKYYHDNNVIFKPKKNIVFDFKYIRDVLLDILDDVQHFSGEFDRHIEIYLCMTLYISDIEILHPNCETHFDGDHMRLLGEKYLCAYVKRGADIFHAHFYGYIHNYLSYIYKHRKQFTFLYIEFKFKPEILRDYREIYIKYDKLNDFYGTYAALCLGDLRALRNWKYRKIRQNITTLFICVKQFGVYRNLRNHIAEYILQFSI